MFKRLAKGAKTMLEVLVEDEPGAPPEASSRTPISDAAAVAEGEVDRLTRINTEYFEVIERLAAERDRWKDMYFDQSSKHLNAQELLRRQLVQARQMLQKTGQYIHQKLGEEEAGQLAKDLLQVELPTAAVVLDYGKRMLALSKGREHDDTNALAERDRITYDDVEALHLTAPRSELAEQLSGILQCHVAVDALRAPAWMKNEHVVENLKLFERLAAALVELKRRRPGYTLTSEQLAILSGEAPLPGSKSSAAT